MLDGYNQIVMHFIRPPRSVYDISQLGPKDFIVNGYQIHRKDIRLLNNRGLVLECSFYQVLNTNKDQRPCVLFLHSNGGCRLEGRNYVNSLAYFGIHTFTFDFSGSGISQGEYVSLGVHESEDVASAISFLKTCGKVSKICVWGRSMGGVSGLIYGARREAGVNCLVADSPFSNLKEVAVEAVSKHTIIPTWIWKSVLHFIRGSVREKAGFDINQLKIIPFVREICIPGIFITSLDDKFINHAHVEKLFDNYACPQKFLQYVRGDHNAKRTPEFFGMISWHVAMYLREMDIGRQFGSEMPSQQLQQIQQQQQMQIQQQMQQQQLQNKAPQQQHGQAQQQLGNLEKIEKESGEEQKQERRQIFSDFQKENSEQIKFYEAIKKFQDEKYSVQTDQQLKSLAAKAKKPGKEKKIHYVKVQSGENLYDSMKKEEKKQKEFNLFTESKMLNDQVPFLIDQSQQEAFDDLMVPENILSEVKLKRSRELLEEKLFG